MKNYKQAILLTILFILFIFITILPFMGCSAHAAELPDVSPSISEPIIIYLELPIPSIELTFIHTENAEELELLIDDCYARMRAANRIIEDIRTLGYPESHPVIEWAKEEWTSSNDMRKQYQSIYNELPSLKWEKELKEYPIATKLWIYLKDLGYNDYVCAGILGNIMAEVGGQTLNIDPTLYSSDKGYYGICQWSKKYSPDIQGANFNEQCDYLRDTIKQEINTFGYLYKKKFNYNSFLELTDERAAALAFAKTYERCAKGSYSIRQSNAEAAYDYFVN